jgi:glycosyltransferase involved in cell wall biosynthesis
MVEKNYQFDVDFALNWSKTLEPLRIVFLGWAALPLQARQGSGYNLSASELATGLALSGHSVFYLNSGLCHNLAPTTFVRYIETWRGIKCHSLFNSQNLAPGAANFGNLNVEISNPKQTRIVLKWLDEIQAQVVHIHSLEGFSLDLISAIRQTGRHVIVTPHDYWYICPHVNLLYEGIHVCMDYKGGQSCVNCLLTPKHQKIKLKQKIWQTIDRVLGADFKNLIHAIIHLIRVRRQNLWKINQANFVPAPRTYKPDPEIALGFNIDDADIHDGLIEHHLQLDDNEKIIDIQPFPLDTNEQFLNSNHHAIALNKYGERRLAGIAALNQASVVIPPSNFLKQAYTSMGLQEQQTHVVRLGQPHFDQINRKVRRSPFYQVSPWQPNSPSRPLRFGFLGTTYPTKGLEVLVRAIPLLPKNIRQNCQFIIHAAGADWPFRKRLSSYPEVSFVGGYDILQLLSFSGEYDVGILPHLWFENSPLVLLEHLHAGKFVIASRLGGPVEWIQPPKNGLLFAAGQPSQLAECISQLVTGEVPIPSSQEIHQTSPLQSYPDYVHQVESIYYKVLQSDAAH